MPQYSKSFYNIYITDSVGSAEQVVPQVIKLLSPKSVVDVGCGVGTWLSIFQKHGITDILGIDGDYVNRDQLLFNQKYFLSHDLTQPLPPEKHRRFDLAVSLEVAEHLPEANADQFISTLVSFAPVILFSAAIPYQGGTFHINEQWPNYWAKLFHKKGYLTVDLLRANLWGNPKVAYYYAQNSLLFIEAAHLDSLPGLKNYVVSPDDEMLSKVHPLKWIETHNPPPMQLRKLLKGLPSSVINSIRVHAKGFFSKND